MAEREILFRGKSADGWHYGNLLQTTNKTYISTNGEAFPVQVIPETVGQYTGLIDKNGKRIFEGDILRDDDNEENGVVEFIDGEFCVVFGNVETHGIYDIACCCYVIGNIHDNPKILKGGGDNG